jgi:hypothetical protein
MAYPLDILAENTAEVIRGHEGCDEAAAWKERFISLPFNPNIFVKKLESYL